MPPESRKVLILHGHGQSEAIIKPKMRFLRRILCSLSPKIDFEFHYLSGIHPAYPDDNSPRDQWVWGHGSPEKDRIRGLEESIAHIIGFMERSKKPFSGIVGFSSGAAMAAIVTSLLERESSKRQPPLLFTICLSGFMLENSYYRDLYDRKISTPVFHTIGVWDATVSAAQTTALAHQCSFPVIFHFEGGHYVPQAKEFVKLDIVLREFLQTIPYFLPND